MQLRIDLGGHVSSTERRVARVAEYLRCVYTSSSALRMRAARGDSGMISVGFKTEAILLGVIFVERLVLVGFLATGQSALTGRTDEMGRKKHPWTCFSVSWVRSLLLFVRAGRSRSREARVPS